MALEESNLPIDPTNKGKTGKEEPEFISSEDQVEQKTKETNDEGRAFVDRINLRLDPTGARNITGYENSAEKKGDFLELQPWPVHDLYREKKLGTDIAALSFGDFHRAQSLRNFRIEIANAKTVANFEDSKTYVMFLQSNGDVESIKSRLTGDREKIQFLRGIGSFASLRFDKERKEQGVAAAGIAHKEQIITALQAEFEREGLLAGMYEIVKGLPFVKEIESEISRLESEIETYKRDGNEAFMGQLKERLNREKNRLQREKSLASEEKLSNSIKEFSNFLGKDVSELLHGKSPEEFAKTATKEELSDFYNKISEIPDQRALAGVCRDIGVYQAFLADKIGLRDSFAASVSLEGAAHIIAGARDSSGNFFFLNNAEGYVTQHKNFKDAFQEYEQNVMRGITLINYITYGENLGQGLVPVQTRAGEQLQKIATGREKTLGEATSETIEKSTIHLNNSLDISLDRYKIKMALTKETLQGSTTLQFTRLDNRADIYNTIREAIGVHLGHQLEFGDNKNIGIKAGVSYVTGSLKSKEWRRDRTDENIPLRTLLFQLHPQIADQTNLTDDFVLRYGAGIEALLQLGVDKKVLVSGGGVDLAAGADVAYMGKKGELFIGVRSVNALTVADIREAANPNLYSRELDLTAGGKYNLNLEGHRLELQGKASVGLQGLGREAVHGSASFDAAFDDMYYLKLHAKKILPNTFLVSEKTEVEAGIGAKLGDMTVVNVDYYMRKEEDRDNEHGGRVGVTLLFE